ncbi:MAG TPA: glycosyltransferase [Terracidiphilus sp.]|jgi:glycosyltransferase involved in cell wall biosynthesis|nr:glycosyltransferase [Terracidiphilus sp.]
MPGIALFQDYLAQYGGAERVTEAIHQTLPNADLHTTLSVPEKMSDYLRNVKTTTTWMQHLPAKGKLYRHYFLFYPFAVESAHLQDYDLVVSSCCGYAKGVRRGPNAVHVCYCHNPMRWVWRFPEYMARENFNAPTKFILRSLVQGLRRWEVQAAHRPDYFIANSHIVARRLKAAFGVDAAVIEPPIETSRFWISKNIEDYYLVLSRLVSYKRIDLAVQACTRTGRRLLVIGDGPDRERLKAMAGPTVTFLGRRPDSEVTRYASRCRALIFPGEEDFGMAPLEINAAGRPVVAYGAGGATETVIAAVNGILFREQSVDAVIDALEQSELRMWDPVAIRQIAQRYDIRLFQRRILDFLSNVSTAVSESRLLERRAG